MNFLSHYHLHKDENDNYFTVGLTAPDLLGFHSKRIRITKNFLKQRASIEEDKNLLSFIAGMYIHLEIDRLFHKSSFFLETLDYLQNCFYIFTKNNLPHFYAHILVEILVDRYLLEKEPGIADNFYTSYKNFDFNKITVLFTEIKNFSKEKFLSLTDTVSSSSFLKEYTDDNAIISIFERVSKRIELPMLFETDKKTFSEFVGMTYSEIKPIIENFMLLAKRTFKVNKEDIIISDYSLSLTN